MSEEINEESSLSDAWAIHLSAFLCAVAWSDEQGNACAFDPWHLAALDLSLSERNLEEWKRARKEARAADEAWSGPVLRRPRRQIEGAGQCLRLRAEIESGDGGAVLEAVSICATHGLVMPAWLAVAFLERHERVVMGECREWGDKQAFGPALPKGANVAGVRAQRRLAPWAYAVANELLERDPTRPIDVSLYEQIGARIGKKASRVQELIAEFLRLQDGYRPPLPFLKERLALGDSLPAAFVEWDRIRHDAFQQRMIEELGIPTGPDNGEGGVSSPSKF